MCIAPPEAVLEAIEARPSTARTAGVLSLLGAADRARAVRLRAWERHRDVVAFADSAISKALGGDIDSLAAAADAIEKHVGTGDIRPFEAARALTGLGCAAAACANAHLADTIFLRREAVLPGPVLPTLARAYDGDGNITVRPNRRPHLLLAAIRSLLDAIVGSDDPIEQGTLLLRTHRLAAAVQAPEFDHVRTLIDRARDGGGGALLSLVLHRVDEGTGVRTSDARSVTSGVLNYLDFLAGRPTDRGERIAFRRRREWLTSGSWPMIDAELSDDEARTVAQDEKYVQALAAGEAAVAGDIALSRARDTSDTALAVAWNVRALLLFGRSTAASSRVSHAARLLASRLQLHPRDLPAVERFASEIMVACLIEQERFDELLAEREPESAGERLAIACWARVARGESVPAADAARLAVDPRFSAWAASTILAVDDVDTFCAQLDSEHAGVDSAIWSSAARAGCSARIPTGAWTTAVERAVTLAAPSLVPLSWACAWRRGELREWAGVASDVAFDDASNAVASALAIGRLEASVFIDVALEIDTDETLALIHDDGPRVERIRGRLATRDSQRRASGTWRAVTDAFEAVRDEPTLFDRFDAGRAALVDGATDLAAHCFARLADDVADATARARMLALAARAASISNEDDALVLAHRTLSIAASDPQTRDSAWAVLTACTSPAALIGAVATHGAPTSLPHRTAVLAALAAQPDAPATPDAAQAMAAHVPDDLALTALDDELRVLVELADAGVTLDEVEFAWRRAAAQNTSPARTSMYVHAADELAARSGDPTTVRIDAIARAAWSNRALADAREMLGASASQASEALEERLDEVPEPRRAAVLDLAAHLAERDGHLERARRLARKAVTTAGRAPMSHRILADQAARVGAWTDAAGHLEAAGRGETDADQRAEIYRQLGDLYADRIGHRASALENWLVAFIIRSDDAVTLGRLEETYRSEQRWKDLVGAFEVAIAHARDHESRVDIDDVLLKKAEVEYRYLRQPARAGATLIEALDRNPADEHAARILVQALASHVDRSDVERVLKQHLATLPNEIATSRRADPSWAIWLPAE